MPHRLESLPRPAIIAHRGASLYAPENTLAAFELAVQQGADGIELDVRLSADGHLVVIHDANVRHLSGQKGWVSRMTLSELRQLEVSTEHSQRWKGQNFAHERIPTLDEVFDLVGEKLLINVELKPLIKNAQTLSEKVAKRIEHHQLKNTVICSSFSPSALKYLAQTSPGIPRGLLLPKGYLASKVFTFAGRGVTYQTYHPEFHDVLNGTYAMPRAQKEIQPKVFTYTVNDKDSMERLFEIGVDGIFTDDPPLAKTVRGY